METTALESRTIMKLHKIGKGSSLIVSVVLLSIIFGCGMKLGSKEQKNEQEGKQGTGDVGDNSSVTQTTNNISIQDAGFLGNGLLLIVIIIINSRRRLNSQALNRVIKAVKVVSDDKVRIEVKVRGKLSGKNGLYDSVGNLIHKKVKQL